MSSPTSPGGTDSARALRTHLTQHRQVRRIRQGQVAQLSYRDRRPAVADQDGEDDGVLLDGPSIAEGRRRPSRSCRGSGGQDACAPRTTRSPEPPRRQKRVSSRSASDARRWVDGHRCQRRPPGPRPRAGRRTEPVERLDHWSRRCRRSVGGQGGQCHEEGACGHARAPRDAAGSDPGVRLAVPAVAPSDRTWRSSNGGKLSTRRG